MLGLVLLLAIATAAHAGIVSAPSGFAAVFSGDVRSLGAPSPQLGPGAFRIRFKVKYAAEDPAPISQISLRFSRLALRMQGLPLCGLGELRELSASRAIKACAGAEVGHGSLAYRGGLSQEGFSANVPLVAFNGKYRGQPAILARLPSSSHPSFQGVRFSDDVMIFAISKRRTGPHRTSLQAKVPSIEWVADDTGLFFELSLNRRYRADGKVRSYVLVSCPRFTDVPFGAFSLTATDQTELSGVLRGGCS